MTGGTSFLVLPDGKPAGVLTEEQAAQYLGLAPGTLRNWRVMGRGPQYVRLGRRVGYRVEDLQAWAEERLVESRGR